jgi:GT2 family glycosyltransferase
LNIRPAKPCGILNNGIKTTDLSIIIVSWNTQDILRNCLLSVFTQTRDIQFETIVIDNASSDGSAEMVKTEFHQVVLIENQNNRGFAAANNQGIENAHGKYLLLLNSDTVVLDNAVAKMIAFADSHPEAAVVGCRVLNPDKTLQPTCFMFPSLLNLILSTTYFYKLFCRSKFFGRERMTWWDRGDTRQVDVVTGCCMLVRRAAIEQVGVMDEQFFMYAEETDWCYRFKKAGWKVFFAPVAEIIHFGGQSSRHVREEMLIRLKLSILRFIRKHSNPLNYLLACCLMVIFFAVRIPVWLAAMFFVSRRRAEASVRLRAYLRGIYRIVLPCTEVRETGAMK